MNNTVNRKEFFKAQFEKRVHAHFFSTASLSAKPTLNDAMKSSDEQADALPLEKMSTLFIKLIEDMEHFIETNGTHVDAKCSPALLGQAVVHFFADQSHQLFEPGDDLKAYAHLAYWLLRRSRSRFSCLKNQTSRLRYLMIGNFRHVCISTKSLQRLFF